MDETEIGIHAYDISLVIVCVFIVSDDIYSRYGNLKFP